MNNNPHLFRLSQLATLGMILGPIVFIAYFVVGVGYEVLLTVGVSLFSLGFLALVGQQVAAAISWNAGAIAAED